jgi:hypothetical protein
VERKLTLHVLRQEPLEEASCEFDGQIRKKGDMGRKSKKGAMSSKE